MENFIDEVKHPNPLLVSGFEALSIGESFSLFFKEVSRSVDRRLVALNRTAHAIDVTAVQEAIKRNDTLYVKNTGVEILTPEGFTPGMGNMMGYTKNVAVGVFLISNLKTESVRLYDWLKQIVKTGRMDRTFTWAVTDFEVAVKRSENFIKNLPNNSRAVRFHLGQVYFSFGEFFDTVATHNNAVKSLASRDIEAVAKELTGVYELGQLLVAKIKANDLLLKETTISDIENVINKFIWLTNVAGAMMTLLNELTATLNEQAKTLTNLK